MTHSIRKVAAGLIVFGAFLFGQETSGAPPPNFSGMWLVQDPGSGSFEEWFANVPKPELRPEIVEDNLKLQASANAGNVVNTARRTAACPVGNLPLMMASSPALNIVAARDEVLVGAESNRARFIYTDGRDHSETKAPDWGSSGFGHSIGHWEGGTLVVETVAFPARVCDSRHPVIVTPAGGRAKETTRLVERFQLTGPDDMTITFTWEDPTVFLKPHTFTYKFKRVPEGFPFENNDDARDPGYQQRQLGSVSTPEQNRSGRMRILYSAWFLTTAASALFGQNGSISSHPDISGYWELRYDSMYVPRASVVTPLTPAIAAAQVRHDVEAIRWCNNLGIPFILGDRSPLDIRQSPMVTAMVAQVQSSTRYIYTDGRKHPNKDDIDPTTNGHSIGRWEGETLVVDTVSFNDRGATRIPGGGVRGPDSHLVERYRLLDGGARLSATFTWDDTKMFQKPHTYEFRYYRIKKINDPRILPCDPGDQERAQFLLGPDGGR